MKNIFIFIAVLLTVNSFAQKTKEPKVRQYSIDYPDWIVLKTNIDTISCRVDWYSDNFITFKRQIKNHSTITTIRLSSIKGYKIEDIRNKYVDSTFEILVDYYGTYTYKKKKLYQKTQPYLNNNSPMTSGDYLYKAGKLGIGSIVVGILAGLGTIAIKDNDAKIVVGASGAVISTIMMLSAWHNVKLAGKHLYSNNTSLSLSPNSVRFVYRF